MNWSALRDVLVLCNRGWPRPTEEIVKQKEAELRKVLKEAGIEVEDGAVTRLYQ